MTKSDSEREESSVEVEMRFLTSWAMSLVIRFLSTLPCSSFPAKAYFRYALLELNGER